MDVFVQITPLDSQLTWVPHGKPSDMDPIRVFVLLCNDL